MRFGTVSLWALVVAATVGLMFYLRPDLGGGLDRWSPETRPTSLQFYPEGLVRQEDTVEFALSGFRSGETVRLLVTVGEEEPRELTSVRADARGGVEATPVPLPEWVTSGVRQVDAVGVLSGRTAAAELRVRAKGLWVNPPADSVKQGSRFGLVAGGFEPGDTVEVALLPTDEIGQAEEIPLGELVADEVGNTPWTELSLPLVRQEEPPARPDPGDAAGEEEPEAPPRRPDWWQQEIVARGQSGGEARGVLTVVRFRPEVELSPWHGPPGAKVDVNARGFLPEERVRVYLSQGLLGGTEPATVATADADGNLWGAGPVGIPYEAAGGELSLKLEGEESRIPVETTFGVVAPKPWVELSSWSGYPGTGISFTGGGWAAGERVTVHLGSTAGPPVAAGLTDNQGWLRGAGPTSVPNLPTDPGFEADGARNVTYVLVGDRSGATATAEFALIIPFFERPSLPPVSPPAIPDR